MCDITYNVALVTSKISFPNYVEKTSFHYYSTQTGAQKVLFWHIRYASQSDLMARSKVNGSRSKIKDQTTDLDHPKRSDLDLKIMIFRSKISDLP